MHKVLEEMITQTVTASQLPTAAQAELRQELVAHITAQVLDLQLQGKKESEIIQLIQAQFGNTTVIGQQLFAVHHRFEWIPWIGPLLYYTPLRVGAQLFLLHLVFMLAWILRFFESIAHYLQNTVFFPNTHGNMVLEPYWLQVMIIYSFLTFIPVIEGIWLWNKSRSLPIYLEALVLSMMPIMLLIGGYLLNRSLAGVALLQPHTGLLYISLGLFCYGVIMALMAGIYYFKRYLKNRRTV